MSALDPSTDSQPILNQAYTTPGNPASANPVEQKQRRVQEDDDSEKLPHRNPQPQSPLPKTPHPPPSPKASTARLPAPNPMASPPKT
ncbi:hypothetical protein P154DRAFT_523323 [Amniculicola lignicola CBS 123094]|uniref:Uncharacterized protein n=1 Tax=Amniculicola lignicola CBS 123094 TaxID=1392246 RepID=A0A6A5WPJ8_9PLEO|nr:hypothetical protein P154DRAFT_523323 [Amniculicola lignicola CBS 123094]